MEISTERRARDDRGPTATVLARGLDPRRLPGIERLRRYRRDDVRADVVAGLAVTALMVPHGMAYAELAGIPAVNGLYTTVIALVAYALVGPSRLMLLGPDSSLAPLIAAAVTLTVADGDPLTAVAVGSMLALMTGAVCLLAGLARLGSIAELLSRPVQLGYLNGLAGVMIVSQLPKFAGFSVDADAPVPRLIDAGEQVADGATEPTTLVIGLVCLTVVLAGVRLRPALPGVLVAVVGAMLAVRFLDLDVATIGDVPSGFPTPAWPGVDAGDVATLAAAAVGLAWVTLTDTTALSRGFAVRTRERVDPNHEIMALGASNVAVGAFAGFPVSASTSRTTLAFASGGRTQVVGLVSAVAVLIVLLVGGDFIADLPSTALAAIVIAAAIKLFDLDQLRWLGRVRRSEFLLSVAATIAVLALGVLYGLLAAVVLSLINFVRRVWRPYDAVLGRIDQRPGHHDIARHPDAQQVPGLIVFRFDAPLFFANADHFARRVRTVVADRRSAGDVVKRVVVAADPMTDVDTSGAATLEALVRELRDDGVEFAFATLRGPVKDHLYEYGLYDLIGADRFHETVGAATIAYVDDHGVEWRDWTESTDDDTATAGSNDAS
ncbi:MAG: SulP family inorganic anion transporter [Actinomycetota bacterium]